MQRLEVAYYGIISFFDPFKVFSFMSSPIYMVWKKTLLYIHIYILGFVY